MHVAGIHFAGFTAQICTYKIITEIGAGPRGSGPYHPLAMATALTVAVFATGILAFYRFVQLQPVSSSA